MKRVILTIVGFIVLLALAIVSFFLINKKLQYGQLQDRNETVQVDNSQIIGVKTELVDPRTVSTILTSKNVVDNNQVKGINIAFVPNNSNPMFVQQDANGNVTISSGFTIDENGVAHITIYLSDLVKGMEPQAQADLVNYYFWQTADVIATRNLGSLPTDQNYPIIFVPK